jgi:phosphonate transport system substrate-binding protein
MNGSKLALSSILILSIFAGLLGCTRDRGEIGSEKNPIKFFLVPSVDAKLLEATGRKVKEHLEKVTPYKFQFAVPTSYVAVVEAFGTKRADIAALNTFGYIMANDRYKVEAKLTFVRHGDETYKAQIIARTDSKINSLKDLEGKKFAYVDPASTSGFLLPAKILHDKGVKLGQTVFANKHDNVVTMVYQKQVDAGATFYSPSHEGKINDARRLVKTQFPDVEEKVKIVELTDAIPNDPIVFRADLPEEIKNTVTDKLLEYVKTDEGRQVFFEIYGISGMIKSDDKRYDGVREMLRALGKSASDLAKK